MLALATQRVASGLMEYVRSDMPSLTADHLAFVLLV